MSQPVSARVSVFISRDNPTDFMPATIKSSRSVMAIGHIPVANNAENRSKGLPRAEVAGVAPPNVPPTLSKIPPQTKPTSHAANFDRWERSKHANHAQAAPSPRPRNRPAY